MHTCVHAQHIQLLLTTYPKDSSLTHDTHLQSMCITTPFTIAKVWNQPRCSTAENWLRKCGLLKQWIDFFSHKDGWNHVAHLEMDAAGDNQIKQIKPVSESKA